MRSFGTDMTHILASVGTQQQTSAVKLAHVDEGAAFGPELKKGAYGAKYTGNFTPYRKDENGIA
jgi:hypothetical protein